jgi:hypothetical protein
MHARSLHPRLRRPQLKLRVYLKTRAFGMAQRMKKLKLSHYPTARRLILRPISLCYNEALLC